MKFMRGRRIGSMKISAARFLKNLDQIGRDFLQEGKCYVDQDEETGLSALYPRLAPHRWEHKE
jgi:hypothetical protein